MQIQAQFIRQSLVQHGIPIIEKDIPYIQHIIETVSEAAPAMESVPDLHKAPPILVVDKQVIQFE